MQFMKNNKFILFVILGFVGVGIVSFLQKKQSNRLPLVAIANYGSHASLNDTITGLKQELTRQGFIEDKTVAYEIAQVNFDTSLIPHMITQLKNKNPQVMVVMATPIAQFATTAVHTIPLIYTDVTDPVAAGLLEKRDVATTRITGSSDQQDSIAVLDFIKKLLPGARRIGLLYATGESNDAALLSMMERATASMDMDLVALPVDQPRDVAMVIQQFKDNVDCMYVGTSGTIQPTLPVIAQFADSCKIPVINVNADAVKTGMVFASFGVDYLQVGVNTGKLVASVVAGTPVEQLTPVYPSITDHQGYISARKAEELGVTIPSQIIDMPNIVIIK